jgi:hypothetical protein
MLDSMVEAAKTVKGPADVPRTLLEPMHRQLELITQVIERGITMEQDLARQLLAPFDALVDMVEQTGAALRSQAEALEVAAGALADAAGRVKAQAELFERTIEVLREPTDRARAAAGIERRPTARRSRR